MKAPEMEARKLALSEFPPTDYATHSDGIIPSCPMRPSSNPHDAGPLTGQRCVHSQRSSEYTVSEVAGNSAPLHAYPPSTASIHLTLESAFIILKRHSPNHSSTEIRTRDPILKDDTT